MERILRMRRAALIAVSVFAFAGGSAHAGSDSAVAETEVGWTINQTLTRMSFDTKTGLGERNGVTRRGLIAVTKTGSRTLETYWERGAFGQTIAVDGTVLVDGTDLNRVSRIRSLRLNRAGSIAYLESGKGPKSKISLKQDGKVVFQWPRASNVSLLHFDTEQIVYAYQPRKSDTTTFGTFALDSDGRIDATALTELGAIDRCVFIRAKPFRSGLAIEMICEEDRGRDIYYMGKGGELTALARTANDETIDTTLLRSVDKALGKKALGVLAVSGTPDALHFYHAVNGSLLKGLGEPVSMASDEAGKQAWSQSYRTMALGKLFAKTRHPAFASLARRAMGNTLSVRNRNRGIGGEHNPGCAWASRIYSEDKKTALSFMINQAMINGSLIRTCNALGKDCGQKLQRAIDANAICLADNYEKLFERTSGLYRIPRKVPFRFDGIWSPWNWQLSFAYVLSHAGKVQGDADRRRRAEAIVRAFYDSVSRDANGALWRYWTPQYYKGWTADDDVSSSRPTFRPKPNERFEDINHAGISLMALCEFGLPEDFRAATSKRLAAILGDGPQFPRDIDGRGPRNPKWFPAAGWDCLGSKALKTRYARLLPYAAGGAKHAAYTRLYDSDAPFRLQLTLTACDLDGCKKVRDWQFGSAEAYLQSSPYFRIVAND